MSREKKSNEDHGTRQGKKTYLRNKPVMVWTEPNLRNCLNKTYKMVRSEKYEDFLYQLGTQKAAQVKAVDKIPTVKLTRDKDLYVLITTYPENKPIKVKFKLGEEVFRKSHDGKLVTSMFKIRENKLLEVQKWGNREIKISRLFRTNDLLVTMEVEGVKCYRFYKSISSQHSIGTETSRRESLFSVRTTLETTTKPQPEVQSFVQNIPVSQSITDEDICL